MRKLIVAVTALTGALLAALLFQQLAVEGSVGPAAMFALAVLGTLFLSLLVTLKLSRSRHKDLVGKLWLAAFAATISYLVLDLAAGWILIQSLSPPLVPDEYRHHKLVPNSHAEFRQPDFAYVQRVNNLGLRGRDVTVEKPAGTYRIVMLGDSFTMGKGVEDSQTFSFLLEQSLQAKLAACGGKRLEVLNAGVDSYAPVLSLIQLKREIEPLKPDWVVLNLDVSDLLQEAAYRKQAVFGGDGEVVAVPQHTSDDSPYERFRDWTGRNLFFTRALLFYVNRKFGHRELTVRQVVTEADPETVAHTLEGDVDRREQWEQIFDSISRIQNRAHLQGAGFLLTVYPWAHQISQTEWVPGRYAFMSKDAMPSNASLNTIKQLASEHDIQILDLFPYFRSYSGKDPLYFKHDMHWTPQGHQVMARGIEDYFVQKQLARLCNSS